MNGDGTDALRRAVAALRGLVIGDAMGAATEGYRPDEVLEVYGTPIGELVEPVNLYPESIPDRLLGEVGPVARIALAAGGLLSDAAGPSPDDAGLAWAVALGIARPPDALDRIMADTARAVQVAEYAGGAALAELIRRAVGVAQESGGRRVGERVAALCNPAGDATNITAFAFGVAYGTQSVRRAVPQAANQGGSASLTAALAGALCGAFAPTTVVESWAAEVERVNDLELAGIAAALLRLRG